MSSGKELEKEIARLKEELLLKSRDLDVYKREMQSLNDQIQILISQMEGQLQLSTRLQKLLVPTDYPKFPGFEFSTKYLASAVSGGDYFDIFEINDRHRFGVILASSSGHGMAALLLSILIKLSASIEAQKGVTAKDAVLALSSDLQKNINGAESASLFLALFDRRDLSVSIASVGDIQSWHCDSEEKSFRPIVAKSEAIKSDGTPQIIESDLSLSSKDRLVFLTPGVSQLTNEIGEEFGIKRIEEILTEKREAETHDLRNEIIFRAEKFISGRDLQRDVTVVVVDVKDRVLKLAKI